MDRTPLRPRTSRSGDGTVVGLGRIGRLREPLARPAALLALKRDGVEVHETADSGGRHKASIKGGAKLKGRPVSVPADPSSAAFLIAAALTFVVSRDPMTPAKPHALGPCFAAKSDANESGCSLTRKFTPPWRYSVIAFALCFATAVKPIERNNACRPAASGAANSTNSKPLMPSGFG